MNDAAAGLRQTVRSPQALTLSLEVNPTCRMRTFSSGEMPSGDPRLAVFVITALLPSDISRSDVNRESFHKAAVSFLRKPLPNIATSAFPACFHFRNRCSLILILTNVPSPQVVGRSPLRLRPPSPSRPGGLSGLACIYSLGGSRDLSGPRFFVCYVVSKDSTRRGVRECARSALACHCLQHIKTKLRQAPNPITHRPKPATCDLLSITDAVGCWVLRLSTVASLTRPLDGGDAMPEEHPPPRSPNR